MHRRWLGVRLPDSGRPRRVRYLIRYGVWDCVKLCSRRPRKGGLESQACALVQIMHCSTSQGAWELKSKHSERILQSLAPQNAKCWKGPATFFSPEQAYAEIMPQLLQVFAYPNCVRVIAAACALLPHRFGDTFG